MTGLIVVLAVLSVLSWVALHIGLRAHHQVTQAIAAIPDDDTAQPDTWPVRNDDSTLWPYHRGASQSARFLSGRR